MVENRQKRRAEARERALAERQSAARADARPAPSPAGVAPSWRSRVRGLFRRWKVPGWLAFIYVALSLIPDVSSRINFWLDAAKVGGAYMTTAATILSFPYFNGGLLVFGLLWLLFVGEPIRGVQRHPWLQVAGWAIFVFFVSTVVLVAGYGYFEIRVSEVAADNSRGDRHIDPQAYLNLINYLRPIASEFTRGIDVDSVDTPEANAYAIEIMRAMVQGGLKVQSQNFGMLVPQIMRALSPKVRGVFFQVKDTVHPPKEAVDLANAFLVANIQTSYANNAMLGPDNYRLSIGLR